MKNGKTRLAAAVGAVAFCAAFSGAFGATGSDMYVQEGLVAHWDGIDNAGRGVHDSSAVYWHDLSGNNHRLGQLIAGCTWTENALRFPEGAYSLAAQFQGSVPVAGNEYASFDIAYKEETRPKYALCLFGFGNFKGFVLYDQSGVGEFVQFNNGQGWACSSALNVPHHVYAGYGTPASMVADTFYFDGNQMTERLGNDSWTQGSPGLGYANNANWPYHGLMYGLRLYSRPLTANEIAINRAVDSVRFHGVQPADVDLPVGYTWNNDGTITLADAVTFTAEEGAVCVDGAAPTTSATLTKLVNERVSVKAVTPAGKFFLRWTGDVTAIAEGDVRSPEITVCAARPITLTPEFTSFAGADLAAADLLHRWSFNGDCKDSIGGRDGTAQGYTSWNDDASAIVLRGGGRGTSSVDLGTGCFPLEDGPVTIEVWATQNAVQNWSRVFDIGSDTGDYLLISWTRGTTAASDCANLNYRNVGEVFRGEDKLGGFELGTKFHISMTLTPCADGFVDVKWSKRDAMTGHVIAASSATTKTTFPTSALSGWHFFLGRSFYNDSDASATYDEVRVWKKALTDAQLAWSARLGPDSLPTEARAGETAAITTACEGSGSVTVDGNAASSAMVDIHAGVAVVATPSAGSKFGEWKGDIGQIVEGSARDASVVVNAVRDMSLTAVFVPADTPATATWRGEGDRTDVNDPANWTCFDAEGNAVTGAVPGVITEITISGDTTFNCPPGQTLSYASLTIADCTLTADCDWRGLGGNFTIEGVIELNGKRLLAADLPGAGTIKGSYFLDSTAAAPAVMQNACFWLDAADVSTIEKDGDGNVLSWTSKDASQRVARSNALPGTSEAADVSSAIAPTYGTLWGIPALDFGAVGSRHDLMYDRFTNLRTVFLVIRIDKNSSAFLLGDRNGGNGSYNFHRGGNGQYGHSSHSKYSGVWDGATKVNHFNENLDAGLHVISIVTSQNCNSDSLTDDRHLSNGQRTGGRHLSEVVFFSTALSDADRVSVAEYLQRKWMAGSGELVLDVEDGRTVTNSSIVFQGNMKFVKAGAGTFRAARTQQLYSGGTDVTAGRLMCSSYGVNLEVGSVESMIYVRSGAVFDAPSLNDFFQYHFVLDGGTIDNSGALRGTGAAQLEYLTLAADSMMSRYDFIGTGYTPCTAELDGHTLSFAGERTNVFNTELKNGTLKKDEGMLAIDKTSLRASTANIDIGCELNLAVNGDVKDITVRTPAATAAGGNGVLTVHGVFRPASDYLHNFKMAGGSTLDLSARTDVFPARNDVSGRTLSFAGGTVTVDVHGRTLQQGERLVAWSAAPANVTFQWDAETAAGGAPALHADATGIYYGEPGPNMVVVAHWTGAGGDGDVANAANWACTNASAQAVAEGVPGMMTEVHFAGDVNAQMPAESGVRYLSVDVGNCTLMADCDWRGLGDSVRFNGIVDLQGHKLHVTSLIGPGRITDDRFPVGYKRLNYIQGAGAQRIKTSYMPAATDTIEAKINLTTVSGNQAIWCVRGTNATDRSFTCFAIGNRFRFDRFGGQANATQTSSAGVDYVVAANGSTLLGTINGAEVATMTAGNFTPASTLSIFASHYNGVDANLGNYGSFKLYYLSVTPAGAESPSRIYYPAKRLADGMVGVMEYLPALKEYKFLANAGSGAFVEGGEVEEGAAPGELHLEVAEGESVMNTSVVLSGNMKLVKDGAGEFVPAKKAQSFLGGMHVTAGGVRLLVSGNALTHVGYESELGGAITELVVDSGAEIDLAGNYDCRQYTVVLNGGTFANRGYDMTNDGYGSGNYLRLVADSFLDIDGTFTMWGAYQGHHLSFDMAGHTLTARIAEGKMLRLFHNTPLTNGTFRATGGGWLRVDKAATDSSTATLVMDGAALSLIYPLTVRDYVAESGSAAASEGSAALNVLGRFAPIADDFYACTMQDGSTLDLSGRTTVLNAMMPRGVPAREVAFADGATVTVELGERTPELGEQLVAWTEKPASATFAWSEATAARATQPLVVLPDGIYYGGEGIDNLVVDATWTGSAGDGDVANPANWTCLNPAGSQVQDGLPGDVTVVHIGGDVNIQIPVGCGMKYAVVELGDCKLTADCDWRGLDAQINSTIDLNGHKLYVSTLDGTGTVKCDNRTTRTLDANVTAPTVATQSTFWLDASDASSLEVNSNGNVQRWTSKDSSRRVASATTAPVYDTTTYGIPTVDFGAAGSGMDMAYTRLTGLRTVFWVVKIAKTEAAFLLGDTSAYNFHRGASGQYSNDTHSKFASIWNGTRLVTKNAEVIPSETFQVICAVMNTGCQSDRINTDRNCKTGNIYRNGGKQLSELICFDRELTEAERLEMTAYLERKWRFDRSHMGELHVDVPEGEIAYNAGVAITGGVRLFKDGAGWYLPTKTGQTYIGGTEVADGYMRARTDAYPNATTDDDLTIREGALFDIDGRTTTSGRNGPYQNIVVLDGGTIANLGGDLSHGWTMLATMKLESDSYISAPSSFGFVNTGHNAFTLDLGGHELVVTNLPSGKSFCLHNATISEGKFTVTSGGTLNFEYTGVRAQNTDFDLNCAVNVAVATSMRDYTFRYAYDWNAGTAALNVYGVFTPVSDYFYGCTLQNGATLNISGKTGVWNTKGLATKGLVTATFATGSTIYVDLHDRRDIPQNFVKVVGWETAPDNVTFVRAANSGKYVVQTREDGVYAMRLGGTVLFMR